MMKGSAILSVALFLTISCAVAQSLSIDPNAAGRLQLSSLLQHSVGKILSEFGHAAIAKRQTVYDISTQDVVDCVSRTIEYQCGSASGYSQRVVDIATGCRNDSYARNTANTCARNDKGETCGAVTLKFLSGQTNAGSCLRSIYSGTCSSSCRDFLQSAKDSLGCCFNAYFNQTDYPLFEQYREHVDPRLWDLCKVDPPKEECKDSGIKVEFSKEVKSCTSQEILTNFVQYECSAKVGQPLVDNLMVNDRCYIFSAVMVDACSSNGKGQYCAETIGTDLMNTFGTDPYVIALNSDCGSRDPDSGCSAACKQSMIAIKQAYGCCVNVYNDSSIGLQLGALSYNVWKNCEVESPGFCQPTQTVPTKPPPPPTTTPQIEITTDSIPEITTESAPITQPGVPISSSERPDIVVVTEFIPDTTEPESDVVTETDEEIEETEPIEPTESTPLEEVEPTEPEDEETEPTIDEEDNMETEPIEPTESTPLEEVEPTEPEDENENEPVTDEGDIETEPIEPTESTPLEEVEPTEPEDENDPTTDEEDNMEEVEPTEPEDENENENEPVTDEGDMETEPTEPTDSTPLEEVEPTEPEDENDPTTDEEDNNMEEVEPTEPEDENENEPVTDEGDMETEPIEPTESTPLEEVEPTEPEDENENEPVTDEGDMETEPTEPTESTPLEEVEPTEPEDENENEPVTDEGDMETEPSEPTESTPLEEVEPTEPEDENEPATDEGDMETEPSEPTESTPLEEVEPTEPEDENESEAENEPTIATDEEEDMETIAPEDADADGSEPTVSSIEDSETIQSTDHEEQSHATDHEQVQTDHESSPSTEARPSDHSWTSSLPTVSPNEDGGENVEVISGENSNGDHVGGHTESSDPPSAGPPRGVLPAGPQAFNGSVPSARALLSTVIAVGVAVTLFIHQF